MTRKVVNFPQEWVAGFTRNQWQVWAGMGGRFGQESTDGQIAAIAGVNGLILVTRNISDFEPFSELKTENWHSD